MARYEGPRHREPLSGLLTEDKGLQGLLETVRHQVLEAQVPAQIGAQPYERSAGRKAYGNGSRLRTLTPRGGPLERPVAQVRAGRCSTTLCSRDQRSEQALGLALREMGLNGVSTRQGARSTEELCGTRLARSTGSPVGIA